MSPPNSTQNPAICLLTCWLHVSPDDSLLPNRDSLLLARDAPVAVDEAGQFVDLGPRLREAFGGAGLVQATLGAELELWFRWVEPPPDDDE